MIARINAPDSGVFISGKMAALSAVSPYPKPKPCAERTQFAKNVARLRFKTKLTQEEFAEKAGLGTRYFQRIEAGESWPSITVLNTLRKTLGCSWAELLSGID